MHLQIKQDKQPKLHKIETITCIYSLQIYEHQRKQRETNRPYKKYFHLHVNIINTFSKCILPQKLQASSFKPAGENVCGQVAIESATVCGSRSLHRHRISVSLLTVSYVE